jgi:lysozyme
MIETIKGFVASLLILCSGWCSTTNTVYGIDVSHRQGDVDWVKVSQDELDIKFVYVKASEGTTYRDAKFAENARGARDAGLDVGAYHFFRMTSSARSQFRTFKSQMDKCDITLRPVLDVETLDGKTSKEIRDSIDVFVRLVHKHYGVYPIMYGADVMYKYYCSGFVKENCDFFIGELGLREPRLVGGRKYDIWQFDIANVSGIKGRVDIDKLHPSFSLERMRLPMATSGN